MNLKNSSQQAADNLRNSLFNCINSTTTYHTATRPTVRIQKLSHQVRLNKHSYTNKVNCSYLNSGQNKDIIKANLFSYNSQFNNACAYYNISPTFHLFIK